MADFDDIFNYELLYSKVEHVFQGHGQDIVMREATKDSGQYWGTPDILLPALAVLIWILETTGRTIIEEIVKKAVAKEEKEKPDIISELEKRVRHLELLLEELLAQENELDMSEIASFLRETAFSFKVANNHQKLAPTISPIQAQKELSAYLERIGFTRRKSTLLARQIIMMLPPSVVRETHEDA